MMGNGTGGQVIHRRWDGGKAVLVLADGSVTTLRLRVREDGRAELVSGSATREDTVFAEGSVLEMARELEGIAGPSPEEQRSLGRWLMATAAAGALLVGLVVGAAVGHEAGVADAFRAGAAVRSVPAPTAAAPAGAAPEAPKPAPAKAPPAPQFTQPSDAALKAGAGTLPPEALAELKKLLEQKAGAPGAPTGAPTGAPSPSPGAAPAQAPAAPAQIRIDTAKLPPLPGTAPAAAAPTEQERALLAKMRDGSSAAVAAPAEAAKPTEPTKTVEPKPAAEPPKPEEPKKADVPPEPAKAEAAPAEAAVLPERNMSEIVQSMGTVGVADLLARLAQMKAVANSGRREIDPAVLDRLPPEIAARIRATGVFEPKAGEPDAAKPEDGAAADPAKPELAATAQPRPKIVRLPDSIVDKFKDQHGIHTIPRSDSWLATGGMVRIPLPGGGDIKHPDHMKEFGVEP